MVLSAHKENHPIEEHVEPLPFDNLSQEEKAITFARVLSLKPFKGQEDFAPDVDDVLTVPRGYLFGGDDVSSPADGSADEQRYHPPRVLLSVNSRVRVSFVLQQGKTELLPHETRFFHQKTIFKITS